MACTACIVCLISAVRDYHKNALGRGSTSSGHITKFEQSRFSLEICDFKTINNKPYTYNYQKRREIKHTVLAPD
jgi:hypothetical protein